MRTLHIIIASVLFLLFLGVGFVLFFIDFETEPDLVAVESFLWYESFNEINVIDLGAISGETGLSKQVLCNDEDYFLSCMILEVQNNFENVHCGTLNNTYYDFSMSELCYLYYSYSTKQNFCSLMDEELSFICLSLYDFSCPPPDLLLETYEGLFDLELVVDVIDFTEDSALHCEQIWAKLGAGGDYFE